MTNPHIPTPEELERGEVPTPLDEQTRPAKERHADPAASPAVHQMSIVVPHGVGERLPRSSVEPTDPGLSDTVGVEPMEGRHAAQAPEPTATAPPVVVARARGRQVRFEAGSPMPPATSASSDRLLALGPQHCTALLHQQGDAVSAGAVLRVLLPLARHGRREVQQTCLGLADLHPIGALIPWLGWVQGWPAVTAQPVLSSLPLAAPVLGIVSYIARLSAQPTRLARWQDTRDERKEMEGIQLALAGLCENYGGLRSVLDADANDPTGKSAGRAIMALRGRYDDPALVAARPYRADLAELRALIGDPPPSPSPGPLGTGDDLNDALATEVLCVVPELTLQATSPGESERCLLALLDVVEPERREALAEQLRDWGLDLAHQAEPTRPAAESTHAPETDVALTKVISASAAKPDPEAAARRAQKRQQAKEQQAEAERAAERRRDAARRGAATRAATKAAADAEEERRRAVRQEAARKAAVTRAARREEAAAAADCEPAIATTVAPMESAHVESVLPRFDCRHCAWPLVTPEDRLVGHHSTCGFKRAPKAKSGLFSRMRRKGRHERP